jgi:ribosomal protein L1
MPKTKFDETLVQGIILLPHGSGRSVKVLTSTDDLAGLLASGADEAGLRDAWQKSMIVSWISMLPEQLY